MIRQKNAKTRQKGHKNHGVPFEVAKYFSTWDLWHIVVVMPNDTLLAKTDFPFYII